VTTWPTSSELRQAQLARAFRRLATELICDRRPKDHDFLLLITTAAEAIVSGDRPQLEVFLQALKRLARYVPKEQAWTDEVRAHFWTVGAFCATAILLLDLEFDHEARD
jgi:hypothetical protein